MELITNIEKYIDVYYLIAFMSITYVAKSYVHEMIVYLTKLRIKKAHAAVFIIGTITALPFWLYFGHDRLTLFMTYCIGVALHSHLISYVLKAVKKKTE